MTIAVDLGRKATKQINKRTKLSRTKLIIPVHRPIVTPLLARRHRYTVSIEPTLITFVDLISVTKLGEATMALAREAAPHIRKQGEKYLPKSLKEQSGEGKSTVDSVIEVAASGLKGRFKK